jgi:hypothetical protein
VLEIDFLLAHLARPRPKDFFRTKFCTFPASV